MKTSIRPLLIAFIALMFAQLAAAQMGMARTPSIAGVFTPQVGSGAAYEMTRKDADKMAMEMYVVGKEGTGYWIEYSMQSPHGTILMKSLLARESDNVVMQRTIMQMPGRPPM